VVISTSDGLGTALVAAVAELPALAVWLAAIGVCAMRLPAQPTRYGALIAALLLTVVVATAAHVSAPFTGELVWRLLGHVATWTGVSLPPGPAFLALTLVQGALRAAPFAAVAAVGVSLARVEPSPPETP
jgi:hypothetical protein